MGDIIFSCPTLRGELQAALAAQQRQTPVVYLPARLHADPKALHTYLQSQIDHVRGYDRIWLCVSGCGGGTRDLNASTAQLVIPNTSDCIDILLSGGAPRRFGEIYLTQSWMAFMQAAGMDLASLTARLGEQAAKERIRRIFAGFPNFNIIDTGAYDLSPVRAFAEPIVQALEGNLTVIPGKYEILHKIAAGRIDGDFTVVPRSGRSAD